jgi:adenylosuccinate synthase
MPASAVVGVNWGDEGKGRVVDYLAGAADVIVRFQGGNNAGHTVVNDRGLFKLHLIPSGVFHPTVTNILGTGMVVDLEALAREIDGLAARGVTPLNLKISDRAAIVFPFHREIDALEEERLAQPHGSTKRGIAPAFGDRYLRKAVLIGELLHPDYLRRHLADVVQWSSLVMRGVYGKPGPDFDETLAWTEQYGDPIRRLITDTGLEIETALATGKRVLFEGQLGALRDLHYGMYPYVTSSSCLASFARIGGGLFEAGLDSVIGVMKAYSTVIGEGPFVSELDGELALLLRERGGEYGTATGRPRRVGWFDAVGSRYGARVQGVTEVILTKLDVLSGLPRLQICRSYATPTGQTDRYPLIPVLETAQPVYEELPGWEEDIGSVRNFNHLPKAARNYVLALEELVGKPITLISVGAERQSMIERRVP